MMEPATLFTLLGLAALGAFVVWGVITQMGGFSRRRARRTPQPFPAAWERVLRRHVAFYAALSPEEQERFRTAVHDFIDDKRITGVKTDIDDTTRVLVAASAVIPIFGFPGWEWNHIREVLVYPQRFNEDYGMGDDHSTLGMVGSGAMNGVMILSKPDLLQGFRNPRDKRNVGIHEFAHLIDKADGSIDGVPTIGLEKEAIKPWLELIRHEMQRIRSGDSRIDPYGITNEAEFFAVASEYFFERPGVLQRRHPELYAMLEKVFRQDMRSRAGAMLSFRPRTGGQRRDEAARRRARQQRHQRRP